MSRLPISHEISSLVRNSAAASDATHLTSQSTADLESLTSRINAALRRYRI